MENIKLIDFMNEYKVEIVNKLHWGWDDNDLLNIVNPKNVKFIEYSMDYGPEGCENGVTIKEPEDWDLCPHYGKAFMWLEEVHKNFLGEEREPYKILDIYGKQIAYIEYNV
jgi:hypothetical protein